MAINKQQAEELRKKYNLGASLSDNQSNNQGNGFVQGLQSSFNRAGQRLQSAFEGTKSGQINPLSGSVQTTGAVGGLVGDILFEGLKAVTPKAVKRPVAEVVQGMGEAVSLVPGVKEGVSAVSEWAKRHPEAAANLGATLDTLNLIPVASGTKSGVNALSTGVKKGVQVGEEVLGAVNKIGTGSIGAAKDLGTYTQGRLPKLLSIFSGEGNDIIETALRNPKAARLAIEQGDDAIRNAVKIGSEQSVKIKNAFVTGYNQAKQKTIGNYTKTLIPKNNVKGIFNKLLKDNNVIINKDGTLDFSVSKIIANPGEITKIERAWEALDKWDKFTIDSLDEYTQLIGKLTKFATEAGVPSKSPFLGSFYNELNKIAYSKLPKNIAVKFKSLKDKFSQNIELYDDMIDAFNSGDPFTKLANALGKNKDSIRQVIDFYEKKSGKDILPLIAGRELAMEKTASFGFLNPRSWIDFFISPKVQAEIITKIGEKIPKK